MQDSVTEACHQDIEVAEDEEEIPLFRRLGIPMLNDWDLEENVAAESSAGVTINDSIPQPILPELGLTTDNNLIDLTTEYSYQENENEEASNNNLKSLQPDTPAHPSPVPQIFSPALTTDETSSGEDLDDHIQSQCVSNNSEEDQAFLSDFHAAEDEEDDENPVTVVVPPVNNAHSPEKISEREPMKEESAKKGPVCEETSLLAGGAKLAENAKNAAVAAIKRGEASEGVPGAFPSAGNEAEETTCTCEPRKWSLRAIFGAAAAIGVPMSIIYPTMTAFVLFGIIRYARSRC